MVGVFEDTWEQLLDAVPAGATIDEGLSPGG
jgi:hypothetical protein